MKRTPLWLGRIARILVLISVLVFASKSLSQNLPIQIETTKDRLIVKIKTANNLKAGLLNTGPAYKALIKLSGLNGRIKAGPVSGIPLPLNAEVKKLQLTPLGKGTGLLTVEFSRKTNFTWQSGRDFRLEIPLPEQLSSWEKHYRAGLKYHKSGQLEKALSEYRKAVFQNRKHGNAYYKAGQIRAAFGQYRLAEINYNHALRLNCDSLGLYQSLADLYQKTGQAEKAASYRKLFAEKKRQIKPVSPERVVSQKESEPKKDIANLPDHAEIPKNPPQMVTSDSLANAKVIPVKTRWQFAGIAVLLIGIIAFGFRSIRNRRKNVVEWIPPTKLNEEELNKRKQRILDMAKESRAKVPADQPAPKRDSTARESVITENRQAAPEISSQETKALLEKRMSRSDRGDVDLFSDEPIPHWKRYELAKSLNLGIGEIELALNIKSHQRQAGKSFSFDQSVLQKLSQNKSISEIAKEMGVGKGEVELLLAMQNSAKNNV